MKWLLLLFVSSFAFAQSPTVPAFTVESGDIPITRTFPLSASFDKCGRMFAIVGDEAGHFEAWGYPLKLARACEFSFATGNGPARPAHDLLRSIVITPEATTFSYGAPSFSVRAVFITAHDVPGACILLDVNSSEPLTIGFSFIPVLQAMWPAGIGGQGIQWDDQMRAFILNEPTKTHTAIIGSPAATGYISPRGYLHSETASQFRIEIRNPDSVRGRYLPIVLAGGSAARDSIQSVYRAIASNPEAVYRSVADHFRRMRAGTMRIQTPNSRLNLAFEWSKIALDNLFVTREGLGTGLVAGIGRSGIGTRPGMGWFFGTEAMLNTFALTALGATPEARTALSFYDRWRRSDGKLPHEIPQSASLVDWWSRYPYGYLRSETTPLMISAVGDYVRASGDSVFLAAHWDQLQTSANWISEADENHDGLIENRSAGPGPIETGPLAAVQSDCFSSAAAIRAAETMGLLAQMLGDTVAAQRAAESRRKAGETFDEAFWNEHEEAYAYGRTGRGTQTEGLTPWSAFGLQWNIGEPRHILKTIARLNGAESSTDWGVRSLSNKSKWFDPFSTLYGGVRSCLSGWLTTAQFRHHFSVQGYASLLATASHTFDDTPGAVADAFSGYYNIRMETAGSHHGSGSSAIAYPMVRGLCGLDASAPEHRVWFTPHFPADWDRVLMSNYRVGDATFEFEHTRTKTVVKTVIRQTSGVPFLLTYAPALGAGSYFSKVRIDGKEVPYKVIVAAQTLQPLVELPTAPQTVVEVELTPSLEFLAPAPTEQTGESNRGLKIVTAIFRDKQWKLTLDGIAGSTASVSLLNDDTITSVSGCERRGAALAVTFPKGPVGEYTRKEIFVTVR